MDINPAMNHEEDISVLGYTEITVIAFTSFFSQMNRTKNNIISFFMPFLRVLGS